jgi:hypothetical protein
MALLLAPDPSASQPQPRWCHFNGNMAPDKTNHSEFGFFAPRCVYKPTAIPNGHGLNFPLDPDSLPFSK